MNALYQSARALLRNRTEADDAVQETYLQAWKSFDRFTPGTNCRAWMFSILFNVVRHQRRKWLFRVSLVEDPQEFERTLAYSEPVPEVLHDEEMLEALRQIPQQQAEVVILADVHELAYKEIQDALGIPIGTVMSRLSRGRLALRGKLADAGRRMGIGPAPQPSLQTQQA
jgi:RNA polymerase sigma-70 factor (ECF subfamily)